MPKAKAIAPFYDESSSAPPPFPAMLTDQLELFGNMPRSSSLLVDEIVPPIPPKFKKVEAQRAPSERRSESKPPVPPKFKKVEVQRAPSERPSESKQPASSKHSRTAQSPYPAKKGHRHSRGLSESPSASLSELSSVSESSDATSDSESTLSTSSEGTKIPKPPGEPGRPGRGGYNLETALDWNSKAYTKLKKLTHKLIDEHLDTTKCASSQNATVLNGVRDKARDAFPDLENYHNYWPVMDMIMMRLKYTSSRARRHASGIAAGKAGRFSRKTAKRVS